jgi:hypothetical protein
MGIRILFGAAAIAVLTVVSGSPVSGQEPAEDGIPPGPPSAGELLELSGTVEVSQEQALATDAAVYAKYFDVTPAEAARRIEAQTLASDAVAVLQLKAPRDFTYWGVDHTPRFTIYVGSANPEAMREIAPTHVGEYLLEVRKSPFSKERLREVAGAVYRIAPAELFDYDYSLDGPAGLIRFDVASQESIMAIKAAAASIGAVEDSAGDLALPDGLRIRINAVESTARSSAFLMGGRALSSCTSGFPIYHFYNNNPNHASMTTAGHCPDQSFGGCALPTFTSTFSGNTDKKATGSGSCNTMPGLFFIGSEQRRPTSYQDMGRDTFHCKYGKVTLAGCGTVTDDSYDPGYLAGVGDDFRMVTDFQNGSDLSEDGDSGGPWYLGTVASGIMSGQRSGGHAIVSPGPRVFTSPTSGLSYRLRNVDA